MAEETSKNQIIDLESGRPVRSDQALISPEEEPVELSVFDMLNLLPPPVKEYLLSSESMRVRAAVYNEFGLTENEADIASYLELDVFFGNVPLDLFPDVLWSQLPWKDDQEEKAWKLANEIIGRVMLPAEPFLGDVSGLLKKLGADPSQFPQNKIRMMRKAYTQAAKDILDGAGLADSTEEAKRRALKVVEARLRDVRDDLETKGLLTKALKVGGSGLTEAQADQLIGSIGKTMETSVLTEGEEKETKREPSENAGNVKGFTPKQIHEIYLGTSAEQKQLALATEAFLDRIGQETGGAIRAFDEALFPQELPSPETWTVVAGILTLAQRGDLLPYLKEENAAKRSLRDHLRDRQRRVDEVMLDKDPLDKKVVNLYLQFLYRRFAGLDAADSARYGLRTINAMKKKGNAQYQGLVAFDADVGKFIWLSQEQF